MILITFNFNYFRYIIILFINKIINLLKYNKNKK